MKYLITGGCGFVGSNLAAEVLRRQDELVVFDSLFRHGSAANLDWLKGQGGFTFVHGDIRNRHDISRTVQQYRPDAIFHLAGQVAMTTSVEQPERDFETNVLGSFQLLESVREYIPDAPVLYSSTNKVYGDLEHFEYCESNTRFECPERPDGFDEATPLDFRSPYGCSKGAADQYLLDYARTYGLKTVVFRHSSMYGGRQFATYDQGWVGWFCQQALNAKARDSDSRFTISGNGKQVRDVLHADDVTALYFGAVDHIDSAQGQAFNIGGGMQNSLSLLELFSLLEELLSVRLEYDRLPPRQCDQKVFVADTGKAERLLEWIPRVSTSTGIQRTLDWLSART